MGIFLILLFKLYVPSFLMNNSLQFSWAQNCGNNGGTEEVTEADDELPEAAEEIPDTPDQECQTIYCYDVPHKLDLISAEPNDYSISK